MTLLITTSVERAREQNVKFEAPRWLVGGATWLRGRGGRAGQLLLGEDNVQVYMTNTRATNIIDLLNIYVYLFFIKIFINLFVSAITE